MSGKGHQIKEARIKSEISLKELSVRTKIQPRIIKAIEEDAWEKILVPATYRGFVRLLARELSIDPENIFGKASKEPEATAAGEKKIFLRPLTFSHFNYWGYFLLVLIIILFLHFLSR